MANTKRNFKESAKASGNTFNTVATGSAPETPEPEKKAYYFSIKMPYEFKAYLKAAAYRESSPERTVSITEYICNLIQKDMDAHEGGGKA